MAKQVLKIGPRVTALPVIHGSGDYAWEVRRRMLNDSFDCLAVALPASFQAGVESAIEFLPAPSIVVQPEVPTFDARPTGDGDDNESVPWANYVPIDPCQPVIAALRLALGERLPRFFVDLETASFEPNTATLPDAYALKTVSLEQLSAALVPFMTELPSAQWKRRMAHMAYALRELSIDFKRILFVCSVLDWPWVRQAFADRQLELPEHEPVNDVENFSVDPQTVYFLLGELPYITGLYERARVELESDEHLAIDGIKELLIAARQQYKTAYGNRARHVTPHLLKTMVKYIRNLTLVERRLTPELVTVITAAKQVVGDGYALEVLELAKQYPYGRPLPWDPIRMGIDQAGFPDGQLMGMKSRLPGPPLVWSRLQLLPKPDQRQRDQWKQRWDPYAQCSWPPEDVLIENFRSAVFDRAKQAMGADLAKTEKFTTSLKDGIDIRDTLRHWYDGDIYVKVLPPSKGHLDAVVMLFDSPADPRDYPWRTTWFAEHKDESTLAFYATDFAAQPVGPGICLATYGGALLIYPPIAIPDIWTNPHLDFAETLEERLLAAACRYSQCRQIALLSSLPPGPAWRQIAKRFKKSWVHLPLGQFSDSTVQQLRMVHVLNGKQVRSYAASFIRRA